MTATDAEMAVLTLADSLELYYDLLEQSKGLDQHVRMLRDRILKAMAARKMERVQVDGYEAIRELRHHPPQLDEERAVDILKRHGRLDECQIPQLDEKKARSVIDELLRQGALSRDELPFIYVKPTEALVVRPLALPAERAEPRRARHAA